MDCRIVSSRNSLDRKVTSNVGHTFIECRQNGLDIRIYFRCIWFSEREIPRRRYAGSRCSCQGCCESVLPYDLIMCSPIKVYHVTGTMVHCCLMLPVIQGQKNRSKLFGPSAVSGGALTMSQNDPNRGRRQAVKRRACIDNKESTKLLRVLSEMEHRSCLRRSTKAQSNCELRTQVRYIRCPGRRDSIEGRWLDRRVSRITVAGEDSSPLACVYE